MNMDRRNGVGRWRSLIADQHHFIKAPRPELYDFRKDPAERDNILENERRVYVKMKQEVDAYGSDVQAPSHIDPEEAKKLAALGYISSTASQTTGPLPDPKDRIGEIATLQDAARREGMKSLIEDGWRLVADGATTPSEVLRVSKDEGTDGFAVAM